MERKKVRRKFLGFTFRLLISPVLGGLIGAIAGGLTGLVGGLIGLAGGTWIGTEPSVAAEALIGAVYLALVSSLYGISEGFIAAALAAPFLLILRRRRFFDAFFMSLAAAVVAWWLYSCAERSVGLEPNLIFLLPRVITSSFAAGGVVLICGRNAEAAVRAGAEESIE